MLFYMAGSFSGEPAEGLTKTTLIQSSKNASKVKTLKQTVRKDQLKSDRSKFDIVIKLNGRFKSAFKKVPDSIELGNDRQHKFESSREATVILIADADFLVDKRWSSEKPVERFQSKNTLKGDYYLRNDNNNFIQNIIEQLNGGDDLISIRSRSINLPPFKIIKELENDAGQKFEDALTTIDEEIKASYKNEQRLIVKINEERNFEKKASLRAELNNLDTFRQDKRMEKKHVRAELHREKEFLKASVLWVNLLFAPLLTAFLGICVWIYRNFKR